MTDSPDAPAFLTTREVAALLRVKERKVYELASAGEIPCRRVTGKLLFPRAEIQAWLAGGAPAPEPRRGAGRPGVVVGSHDPLLDWALRESGAGLASLFDGSLDGLARLAAGEASACGLHVFEPEREDWNIGSVAAALDGQGFVLLEWAKRRQGLILSPEMAARVSTLADLNGLRLTLRQKGSGGRILFEHLLAEAGVAMASLTLAPREARTEDDAAASVASGAADAAFGLEAMARQFRLGFLPLALERFDLAVERRFYFEPPWRRLTAFCAGAALREKAEALGGYDVSEQGAMRWNGA